MSQMRRAVYTPATLGLTLPLNPEGTRYAYVYVPDDVTATEAQRIVTAVVGWLPQDQDES